MIRGNKYNRGVPFTIYVAIGPSDKYYVGQTSLSLQHRKVVHLSGARTDVGQKGCARFYNAIRKYGEHSFNWDVITTAKTKESANLLERLFIILFRSTNPEFGYNISNGGTDGMWGRKHSMVSRLKMSTSQKRAPVRYWLGKRRPDISEGARQRAIGNKNRLGKPFSVESKRKISASLIGNIPWNKGVTHSEETRKKISERLKGKKRAPYSLERCKAISERMKGNKYGVKKK